MPHDPSFPRVKRASHCAPAAREVEMTGIVQTPHTGELPAPGDDYVRSAQIDEPEPIRAHVAGVLGWALAAAVGLAATVWFIVFGPGESGSKAQWFFGATVLVAVSVSLWQTHRTIRRAAQDAAAADERRTRELAAAQESFRRELALIRSIHEAQLDAQRELSRAELTAQVELARVERVQLLAQQQRMAMIEVSRAVNAQTQALSALWNQSAAVLQIADAEKRAAAMNPVFDQIARVVNEFSVELANAHLLIDDDRIHRALDRVNDAVLTALHVAEDVHTAVIDGAEPRAAAVTSAQRLMHDRAAEARHLAWTLLRAGLDDPTESA
jgi:hypothetical protein